MTCGWPYRLLGVAGGFEPTVESLLVFLDPLLGVALEVFLGILAVIHPRVLRENRLNRDFDFLEQGAHGRVLDRKSTRLNSSHVRISYAVFCLKKKNTKN